jgi:hypothetical protein
MTTKLVKATQKKRRRVIKRKKEEGTFFHIHTMKAYRRTGCTAPPIYYLSTRKRLVVKFTTRSL